MQRKHSFWNGRISEFSLRRKTASCWIKIIATQHLLPISTQHPDEKYGCDISLAGAYHDLISHLLKKSCNYGHYSWLKQRKINLGPLTGLSWLATSHARYDECWVEFYPESLSEG